MSCSTRDIHDDMVHQTLHKAGLLGHPKSLLLSLLAVQVVLTPLVDTAFFGQAQGVVSTALNFGHLKSLLKEGRHGHDLSH